MKKQSFSYWKKRELANQLNQIKDEKVTIENMEENLKDIFANMDKEILNSDEVYNIFKNIYEYENVLKQTAEKYEPSILTSYLLDLAKAFNQYYNKHRISTDDVNLRKLGSIICIITSKILVNGMNILGIEMPDKM